MTELNADTMAPAAPQTRRPNVLRRLYQWVLSWADTPYGTPALAVISFTESSFFPIPPDVLQIALSVSRPRRAFYYAAVASVASVLGGIAGWVIGYALWAAVGDFFYDYVPGFTQARFDHVGQLYHDNAFLALLGAAFTPIPYKVFTVAAGVFHGYVPLGILIAASAIGRSGRFFLVALTIFFFGPTAKRIIEDYFEIVTFALFALLVGGFVVIKLLV